MTVCDAHGPHNKVQITKLVDSRQVYVTQISAMYGCRNIHVYLQHS